MARMVGQQANRHHIWYPRRQWLGGPRHQLREHPLSIISLTVEGHERLHRNLQSYEHMFRPRISAVVGMLALAEASSGNDLDSVLERIEHWRRSCYGHEPNTDFVLSQQAKWIEMGWPDSTQAKLGDAVLDGYLDHPESWGERAEL